VGGVFYGYNSPTVVIAAIALFLMFTKVNIEKEKTKKIVAFFSSATFGVYLIHTNLGVWNCTRGSLEYMMSLSPIIMLLEVTVVVLIIFLICTIIEYIRVKLFSLIHASITSKQVNGHN